MSRLKWGILALVLVIGGYGIWRMVQNSNRPLEVRVETLKLGPASRVLAVVGRVRSAALVDIRVEQPGKIVELFVDEGAQVTKGQPLATIAADQPRAQVARAEANVSGNLIAVEQARRDLARTQALANRGFAAPAALEEQKAKLRSAEAALTAARASVADVASLTRKFTVYAPSSGTILVRPVDQGQVADATTILFQLASGGTEIWAEADEALADAVNVGQPARLSASGTNTFVDGAVIEVSPRVDPTTGGRVIRLVANQAGLTSVSGRSIDVNVTVDQRASAITIPRSSLLPGRAKPINQLHLSFF
jgi:RND family efflux transporter MFP subunit